MEVPEIRINLLCLIQILISDGVSIYFCYDHVGVQLKKAVFSQFNLLWFFIHTIRANPILHEDIDGDQLSFQAMAFPFCCRDSFHNSTFPQFWIVISPCGHFPFPHLINVVSFIWPWTLGDHGFRVNDL